MINFVAEYVPAACVRFDDGDEAVHPMTTDSPPLFVSKAPWAESAHHAQVSSPQHDSCSSKSPSSVFSHRISLEGHARYCRWRTSLLPVSRQT